MLYDKTSGKFCNQIKIDDDEYNLETIEDSFLNKNHLIVTTRGKFDKSLLNFYGYILDINNVNLI